MEHRIITMNAIEIASNILSRMQNVCEFGREVIITHYICHWAEEAEKKWQEERKKHDEISYYDFIDSFAEEKFTEFENMINEQK